MRKVTWVSPYNLLENKVGALKKKNNVLADVCQEFNFLLSLLHIT